MRYISPTQLPELNLAADRAQRLLDSLLDDYEALPDASLNFRLSAMDKITDFIYRLTAVRKTLIALRASMNPNITGLRNLTAMIRGIHDEMLSLHGHMRDEKEFRKERDRLYASPSPLATRGRFAPNWAPAIDEIIPEPRLSGRAGSPNPPSSSCSTAIPGCDSGSSNAPYGTAPAILAALGGDLSTPRSPNVASAISVNQSAETQSITLAPAVRSSKFILNAHSLGSSEIKSHLPIPSASSDRSDASRSSESVLSNPPHSSHPSHSSQPPVPPLSSRNPLPDPPDPLDSLADSINSRIPASISDLNFQLPPYSNRAADYAPLYDLDLVPHTPCVSTLPLAAPDLSDQIQTQLNHIETGCTQLSTSIQNILQAGASPLQPAATSDPTSEVPDLLPAEPENSPAFSAPESASNNDLITRHLHERATDPELPPPRSHSP